MTLCPRPSVSLVENELFSLGRWSWDRRGRRKLFWSRTIWAIFEAANCRSFPIAHTPSSFSLPSRSRLSLPPVHHIKKKLCLCCLCSSEWELLWRYMNAALFVLVLCVFTALFMNTFVDIVRHTSPSPKELVPPSQWWLHQMLYCSSPMGYRRPTLAANTEIRHLCQLEVRAIFNLFSLHWMCVIHWLRHTLFHNQSDSSLEVGMAGLKLWGFTFHGRWRGFFRIYCTCPPDPVEC